MDFERRYIGVALGLLAVHALVLTVVHAPVLSSNLLLGGCALTAGFASYQRRKFSSARAEWKWALISAGILIWCIGQGIITYNEGLLSLLQGPTAISSDFYFFLFGIPLLLVMSSADERQQIQALPWIDGLQASIAVYLVYLHIFPGSSGSAAQDAISALRMTYSYNAENLVLACLATCRMLATPSGEEKRIYRVLSYFLWIYAGAAGWLNHLSVMDQLPSGTYYDLLWDLPFVVLTVLVARLPPTVEPEQEAHQTWAGLLVNNASPVFFTLSLLVMGVYVERERFVPGAIAIAVALVSYGFRSSLVQSYAMRTERKLLESEAALVLANEQLGELSFLDRLTGVPNRRRFEEALETEWKRIRRTGLPLSLLVIDIDQFKLLNDRYGHQYGDKCLVRTATALSGCLHRSGELLARYGGEEFVAILPNVNEHEASQLGERMRREVEGLALANEETASGRMTVSIGVATTNDMVLQGSHLFACADRALYQAKREGRNRVEVFSAGAPGIREPVEALG